jgi:chromosome segregation ATPase
MNTHECNPTYLSMLENKELIEQVNYYPITDALSLAQELAFRLREVNSTANRRLHEEIEDLEASLSEAENERDEARAEVDELTVELETQDAKIAELEAQLELHAPAAETEKEANATPNATPDP